MEIRHLNSSSKTNVDDNGEIWPSDATENTDNVASFQFVTNNHMTYLRLHLNLMMIVLT